MKSLFLQHRIDIDQLLEPTLYLESKEVNGTRSIVERCRFKNSEAQS